MRDRIKTEWVRTFIIFPRRLIDGSCAWMTWVEVQMWLYPNMFSITGLDINKRYRRTP